MTALRLRFRFSSRAILDVSLRDLATLPSPLRADARPAARSTHRHVHDHRRLCRHRRRSAVKTADSGLRTTLRIGARAGAGRSVNASGSALARTACGSGGTADTVSVAAAFPRSRTRAYECLSLNIRYLLTAYRTTTFWKNLKLEE